MSKYVKNVLAGLQQYQLTLNKKTSRIAFITQLLESKLISKSDAVHLLQFDHLDIEEYKKKKLIKKLLAE